MQALYLITKLQNLKAIHNPSHTAWSAKSLYLITKLQNLKAIHNEAERVAVVRCVVSNYKITKSESYSQPGGVCSAGASQLYLITKLQNLKAIHNGFCQ